MKIFSEKMNSQELARIVYAYEIQRKAKNEPDSELIDVVNRENNVIGQAPKRCCHKNKLRHRSTKIVTFADEERKYIVLGLKKIRRNRDKLGLIGGHLLSGQTYHEAAVEEFYGELFNIGVPEQSYELEELFFFEKTIGRDREFIQVYRATTPGPYTYDKHEFYGIATCHFKEVIRDIAARPKRYTQSTRMVLQEYLRKGL